MTARDDARQAGAAAEKILAAAEKSILIAMVPIAAKALAGTITPLKAKRDAYRAALGYFRAASSRLGMLYLGIVKDITGEGGKLPDAPGQVSAAILHASRDAALAFGAVMAATGVPDWKKPRDPYRHMVSWAVNRSGGPGTKAAQTLVAAMKVRGLTGYVTPKGHRQPLAAYAERAVRTATARLARSPVTSEIAARREALLAVHAKAVSAAVESAVSLAGARGAVAAFRTDVRVTSTSPSENVAKRWRREAAQSAASAWLASLGGNPAVLAAVSDLTMAGMAEGEADAMAVAAQDQGHGSLNISAAQAAAAGRLQGDYHVSQQARESAAGLAGTVVNAVARALAASGEDSSEDETAGAMRSAASTAAGRWTDWALWGAFGAGAVSLWKRAASALGGLFTSVDVYWTNDSSPCVLCQENANGSPYAPEDVPPYPGHNRCRCSLESNARLPLSWLAAFLS